MIGLVDLALQQWDKPQLCPPNLEIMKLAAYYKQEENQFCRLLSLDETELTGYDKIYVFSEYKQFAKIPPAFASAPNVILGGTAFTNDVYVPFENSLIDFTLPRTNIYVNFLKDKYLAGVREKEINRFLDDAYYRWHAGTEVLPLPAMRKQKRVFIYDTDFFQDGWREVIDKILARGPSSINFIHPAHYTKISDFLEVRENSLIAKTNDAYLDLNIPLKETPILMKHYKNRLLAVVLPSSRVYLSIGGAWHYRTEYYKNLIYKLHLLYVFWSHGIPMKLKYEDPGVGCYDPLADLSKLIAIWSQSNTNSEKNIIQRIPKGKKRADIRPEREQLLSILEEYPSADTLFHQTAETVSKGGFWHYGY